MSARCVQPPARLRPAGFTLMELVLVMLVLTVIVATAMPSLRGFVGWSRSRDAVTQLVALAQYARGRAAADAQVYKLNFDANSYWLTAQTDAGFTRIDGDLGRTFELPEGSRVQVVVPASLAEPASFDGVLFYPDGRAAAGVLRVTDARGRDTLLGSPSAAESFRVLTAEEASQL